MSALNKAMQRLARDFSANVHALDQAADLIDAHEQYAADCLLPDPVVSVSGGQVTVWVVSPYAETLPLSSPVKFIGNKPAYVAECNGVQINVTQKD